MPPDTPAPDLWTAPRLATLTAVVTAILDGAPVPAEAGEPRDGRDAHGAADRAATAADVVRRLRTLAPWQQADLARALDLLGSRTAGLVFARRPQGFAGLADAARARWLDAWATSAVPLLRSAYQALRRLTLGVHYADPRVTARIGYDGPLHRRGPRVPWEGPLPGEPSVAEPVARGPVDVTRPVARPPLPVGVVRGRALSTDLHRTADVVVIGTGAGGAVAAAHLAEAGLEVVMLEAGAWWDAADFTEEEGPLAERLYADGALRATDDLAVQLLQGEAVGGSTTINWMIMLRTPDPVLEEWGRRFGLHDFSPAAMRPVFERVERTVHARAVPDDAHSPNNRTILDGAAALGWRARTAVINADGCVRSGFCGIGCRYDAKRGTLRTYVPQALAAGATLVTDVRVSHLEARERDTGRGRPPLRRVHATAREAGGRTRRVTVDAPLVVVAAGAVGTPVLLERSGLGGGGVGRWLRLHPTTATIGLFGRDMVGSSGIPLSTMCDEHWHFEGTPYGFWLECPPLLPALGAVAAPGHGVAHAALLTRFREMGTVIALVRDGADVERSNGQVGARRDGGTSIRYRLGEADARRVRAAIAAAAELQLAAGAREVHTLHATPRVVRTRADLAALRAADVGPNRVGLFSAHVNGTCRFGTDPATSGADPDGARHGVRGVYVCDGSLLPTALGVNPQETIMALATVVAERLATRFGGAIHTPVPRASGVLT